MGFQVASTTKVGTFEALVSPQDYGGHNAVCSIGSFHLVRPLHRLR